MLVVPGSKKEKVVYILFMHCGIVSVSERSRGWTSRSKDFSQGVQETPVLEYIQDRKTPSPNSRERPFSYAKKVFGIERFPTNSRETGIRPTQTNPIYT